MNLEEIKQRVAKIGAMAKEFDDSAAHINEDNLQADFIAHIEKHGPSELAEMAREVLKTKLIEFQRWHA